MAEAQGRFYLTFFQPLPQDAELPSFESLRLMQSVPQISQETNFIVAEKRTAKLDSAEGEIPYKLTPNQPLDFADLSGEKDAFATIDYSKNPPQVFLGNQVTLNQIGLGNAAPKKAKAQAVKSAALQCPKCAGPLSLSAPDKTERVVCPFCDSLLDVNQGNLYFLNSLNTDKSRIYALSVGAEVSFERFENSAKFKIIGAMTRSIKIDGTKYFGDEYLLYNTLIGFRWLVCSDNDWNYMEPINVADIEQNNSSIIYKDKKFIMSQGGEAKVEYVKGEFYWRIEQGETVQVKDYISSPLTISSEISDKEVNFSLGTKLNAEERDKIFNLSNLSKSSNYSSNQKVDFEFTNYASIDLDSPLFIYDSLLKPGIIILMTAVIFLIAKPHIDFLNSLPDPPNMNFNEKFELSPKNSADEKTVIYTSPFHLEKLTDTQLTVAGELDYESSADFNVFLVPANMDSYKNDSAQIKSTISDNSIYYFPSSQETIKKESLTAPGEYQIKLEGKWKQWQKPLKLYVNVRQYFSIRYYETADETYHKILLLVVLAIVPFYALFKKSK